MEKGYEFDTGIHYVGGEVGNKNSLMGFLFHLLSLSRLRWCKIENEFDVAKISKTLQAQIKSIDQEPCAYSDLVLKIKSSESLHDDLCKSFPESIDAIESFFRLCKWGEYAYPLFSIYNSIPKSFRFLFDWFVKPIFSVYFGTSSYDVIILLILHSRLVLNLLYRF